MHKSFLILSFLILSGSYSGGVAGQSKSPNTQPLAQINNPTNPVSETSTGLVTSAKREIEAKERYIEGTTLAESGQLSQAVENLEQAVKLDPEYADAYSALGRAYFKLQQWQKAADNLHRATALHTKQRDSQSNLRPERTAEEPEDSTTSNKSAATSSQTQPPQTNAGALKSLNSSSTAPPKSQPTVAGAVVKSAPPSPLLKTAQPTNTNTVALRSSSPKTETPSSQAASVLVNAPATTPARKNETPTTFAKLAPAAPQIKRREEIDLTIGDVKEVRDAKTTANSENSVANAMPLKSDDTNPLEMRLDPVGVRVAMSEPPPSMSVETKNVSPITPTSGDEISLTKIYRVGPNDVLDIRLGDPQSNQSTLFTVTPSGFLEHPMLTEPLPVTGLTVDEIGKKIEDDLTKRALIDDPKVVVGVRDYASHSILVSGLVKDSGTRFLRREAIPLYVVVADAQPLPEAAAVTIVRNEANKVLEIDLTQISDMNLLVHPGDVITLRPSVTQFIYIGGEVKNPGEKTFRRSLTLMQAIVGAGGVTPKSKEARIDRDDGRGFLVGVRYQLKDIQSGKTADPVLQPGDRVMILR
jgi:polysaccharide biosynthesis/export protein